jgi:hypothetical protein
VNQSPSSSLSPAVSLNLPQVPFVRRRLLLLLCKFPERSVPSTSLAFGDDFTRFFKNILLLWPVHLHLIDSSNRCRLVEQLSDYACTANLAVHLQNVSPFLFAVGLGVHLIESSWEVGEVRQFPLDKHPANPIDDVGFGDPPPYLDR